MRTKFIACLLIFQSALLFGQTDSTSISKTSIFNKLFYQLTFGVMAQETEYSGRTYDPSITAAIGYKWKNYAQPGIMVGYDDFNQFMTMPLGLVLQGQMRDKKRSPVYYLNGGRTLSFRDGSQRLDRTEGGNFFEAGLGYRWEYDKGAFQISVGWKQQKLTTYSRSFYYLFNDAALSSFWWPGSGPQTKTNITMERVVFRIGLAF